jgi:hypothetical protein
MRRCLCCNSQEILPTLNQKLRAGESYAVLSHEYGLSEDSLRRHHKAHVRGEGATPIDLGERLQLLWDRADELYKHALSVSDTRAAIDALSRLSQVTEHLSKIQVRQSSTFETLSVEDQVQYILDTPGLYVAWLDYCVRQCRYQPPENLAQPSDAAK